MGGVLNAFYESISVGLQATYLFEILRSYTLDLQKMHASVLNRDP